MTAIDEVLNDAKTRLKEITGSKEVVLKYFLSYEGRETNIEVLKNAVSLVCGIPWRLIKGKGRIGEVVVARQMFIYYATDVFKLSTTRVGRMLDRDHTTILWSRDKIRGFIHIQDPETLDKIKLINEYLK